MPVFRYAAKTTDGRRVNGSVRAGTQGDALGELRRQNLTNVTLSEEKAAAKPLAVLELLRRRSVRTADLAIFTRQLATMLSAGIPILEALQILAEQLDNRTFRSVVSRVVERVQSGRDLSESLAEHPRVFQSVFVSMIKAGEASGQLDTMLTRLAEYLEAAEELRREIKSAMTYPVVSLVLILGIVIWLMVGIVPKFKQMFDSLQAPLPPITKGLLATSVFMKQNLLYVFLGAVAFAVAFTLYKRTRRGQRQVHWLLLRVPVFGPLFHKVAIARFSRTFATLIRSGVPILGALEIVGVTSGNRIVEEAVSRARESVRQGETLAEPLERSRIFPVMVTRMIAIGEKTGALEQLLEKVAEFYDQQVKATVAALTSLIEPILIAVMGGFVLFIVLAIFLPILKIQEMIRPVK